MQPVYNELLVVNDYREGIYSPEISRRNYSPEVKF